MDDLTPIQRRIQDELLSVKDVSRPEFDPALAVELRRDIEEGLAPSAALLTGDAYLNVNKYALSQIHNCEGLHAAQKMAPFQWTVANVRGTVAHRAIEAAIVAPGLVAPLDLIDRVVDGFVGANDDWGPGPFLKTLDTFDLARVKAEANDSLVKFLADWPPIDRRWRPRVESGVKVTLCDDRFVLRGKYDLAFGQPQGNQARVIIIDFKTGGRYLRYDEDLRFYALIETLRNGVPPFRVASYYLDAGTFAAEDMSADTLRTAARRVIDGVRKLVAVNRQERDPVLNAGAWCRFCPARDSCEPGKAFMASTPATDDW